MCMCVCECLCACACVSACVRECVCAWVCKCACVNVRVCVRVSVIERVRKKGKREWEQKQKISLERILPPIYFFLRHIQTNIFKSPPFRRFNIFSARKDLFLN